MLALKNTFDPHAAQGVRIAAEVRFATDTFRISVDDGTIDIARGPAEPPDVVIETDSRTLEEVALAGRSARAAERAGELRLRGEHSRLDRLLGVFTTTPS
jgi:alkyl sulfatase BDS1-like metallo-beta-lactamase superfamily hydrolase